MILTQKNLGVLTISCVLPASYGSLLIASCILSTVVGTRHNEVLPSLLFLFEIFHLNSVSVISKKHKGKILDQCLKKDTISISPCVS